MTYHQTLDYLFSRLPMFHRIGAAAYKADLNNTHALCLMLGNPEKEFKSIHIAGTNGKGSTSHFIASVLQQQGYKTAVLICTCPKEVSWLSTLKRAEEQQRSGIQPRYVPREHFDTVVAQLALNAERVLREGKPDYFEVYSRTSKLFDLNTTSITQLATIINTELNRTEEKS